MSSEKAPSSIIVRGTEILPGDHFRVRLQKLARITLDSMVQFVGLLDAQGTVLEINKVALDAVGIELSDVEGKPFWTTFWWQVSEEINATLRASIVRAAHGEFVRWDTPIYGRAGGKETIIIDASLCPVFDDDGQVVFICAEGRDITEKKAQEREIAQKNSELQSLLERIRELDAIKTQFFSNVSHEFRTPLTLILGPLEDAINDTTEQWHRDRLILLQRNALRLQKLVNTLLDFSRIEAGRVQVRSRPTDLAAATAELASNFRSACEKGGLELRVDCPPLPEAVHVDTEIWEKIVLNLMSNAFKFTSQGSIAVSLRHSDRHAELTVKDTGVGIPADQMPSLFERFHRVEGVTGRSQEGSGIGLALVRELVRLHGGDVCAESELGHGTSFTVTIPFGTVHLATKPNVTPHVLNSSALRAAHYVEEALRWLPESQTAEYEDSDDTGAPRSESELAKQEDDAERPRILIADDNADMRRYLARLLSDRYQVKGVTEGRAALEAARRWIPDLVLTDIMMPQLDGFGLLRELRADPRTGSIPVIMLSARAGEESRIDGMEAGADDYLVKPFSARELLARVGAHLQIARFRREASAALRAQDAELQEAQRVAHVGSWRWDAATDVTVGSAELFRIYGLDPTGQAFPNFKDQDGSLYPHDSWQQIHFAVQQTMRTGVGFELDVQALRYGAPIWTTIRGEVVRDTHGNPIGLHGTVQDITVRKRAEEALREADRRKDEFLATLAHELRNPLAPIRNSLHLLRLSGELSPSLDPVREIMERQINQMVRLIDDLLDISRISSGKFELRKEAIELATIVATAVETVQPLIDSAGHQLALSLPAEPMMLDADPVRLAQIIDNLLNNAAKYTMRGGQIWLTAHRDGDEVVISIRDTGVGIPADMLSRVFDMFAQVDRTLSRAQGGLGIGLTLTKSFVEMHGGRIEARSVGPDHGSEFVVYLPLMRDSHRRSVSATPARSSRTDLTRRRILIVDDAQSAGYILGKLLEKMGQQVLVANDAAAALASARSERPDLVISDIAMPSMDGYELARRLRREPGLEGLLLVALTGYGQESDKLQAKEAGFDYHLVKPVSLEALQHLLVSLPVAADDCSWEQDRQRRSPH